MSQKEQARFIRWVATHHPEWAEGIEHDEKIRAAEAAWHARAKYAERIDRNKERRRMENVK